jgi:hypothetical protein
MTYRIIRFMSLAIQREEVWRLILNDECDSKISGTPHI